MTTFRNPLLLKVEEVTEKLDDTQIADEKPETQEEKSEERKESVDMSNAKSMGGAIFGEEKTEEEQPEVPEENGQEEEKGGLCKTATRLSFETTWEVLMMELMGMF